MQTRAIRSPITGHRDYLHIVQRGKLLAIRLTDNAQFIAWLQVHSGDLFFNRRIPVWLVSRKLAIRGPSAELSVLNKECELGRSVVLVEVDDAQVVPSRLAVEDRGS